MLTAVAMSSAPKSSTTFCYLRRMLTQRTMTVTAATSASAAAVIPARTLSSAILPTSRRKHRPRGLLPAIILVAPSTQLALRSRDFSSSSALSALLSPSRSSVLPASKEQPTQGEGGDGDGEKPKYKPLSKWQKYGYIFFGINMTLILVAGGVTFALPDKDEAGNDIQDEFSELPFPSQYYRRVKAKVFKTKKDLEDPFSDKLLPDPMAPPYHQPKYTIVLELTGLLVHGDWTHKHGWRFQKRPDVDMFVSQIGYPNFEVVVYTAENVMTFYPIVDGLDPQSQFIMYRLFRDATRYIDGRHMKDLGALNRDLRKVILVDWSKESAIQKENVLQLKKWEGDNADKTLVGLTQLLLAIKDSDVEDVREVLTYYRQFDDPIEAFRENQRKLQVEMGEVDKKKEAQMNKKSSFVTGFMGFGRSRT